MKTPIGRPRKGEPRSRSVTCDACGTPFTRKMSQADRSVGNACSRACSGKVRKGGPERRFWSFVDRSGGPNACWPWTAGRNRSGYGRFTQSGKFVFAHRAALRFSGVDAPDGAVVMHACDNPPCVNPTHLRVGSWGENIRDMIAKGRNQDRKGARHPLARLTEADVLCIRALAGVRTQAAVAAEYGVCRAQIHRIQARKNWGHVHGG